MKRLCVAALAASFCLSATAGQHVEITVERMSHAGIWAIDVNAQCLGVEVSGAQNYE